jgi:hypothetical protein
MRKFLLTFMASLLSCSVAHAFWPEATVSSLEVGVGYREDSLKWKNGTRFDDSYSYSYGDSIYEEDAGIVAFPLVVRDKHEWKNLKIWQIEAKGTYITCDNIYLRASGDYGWLTNGKHHNKSALGFADESYSDYSDDYAYGTFSNSKHVKGHVYDADIAIGYQFRLCDDSFSFTPLVGYSWNGQHIKNRHHNNDYSTYVEDGISSDSSYYYDYYDYYSYGSSNKNKFHTRWNGPFVGFDFDYRFCCDWAFFGGYEFHWATYHAKNHSEFINVNQRAKTAYGHEFDLGVKWDFCDCWTLAVVWKYKNFWADHGRQRTLASEGEFGNVRTKCYLSTPLKDVKWHSNSISIDVGMVF